MAASITKHAAPLAARQFLAFNRLLVSSPCLSACSTNQNTIPHRHMHRNCPNCATKSFNDEKNTDTSEAATQGQDRPQGQVPGRPTGEGERGSDQLPPSVASMRRRLSEHHGLSSSRGRYTADWYQDYAPSKAASRRRSGRRASSSPKVTESDETTKGSATPSDDFFGIYEDIEKAHEIDAQSSSDKNEKKLKRERYVASPAETFENILTNHDQIKLNKMETVIDLPYGTMRRDQDNIVRSHGKVQAVRYDKRAKRQASSNYQEERMDEPVIIEKDTPPKDQSESNYFDEQYFGNDNIEGTKSIDPMETVAQNSEVEKGYAPSNYQLFENQNGNKMINRTEIKPRGPDTSKHEDHFQHQQGIEKETDFGKMSDSEPGFIDSQYFNFENVSSTDSANTTPYPRANGDLNDFLQFVDNMTVQNDQTLDSNNSKDVDKRQFESVNPNPQSVHHPKNASVVDDNSPCQDNVTTSSDIFDSQYFGELEKTSKSSSIENISFKENEARRVIEDQYFNRSGQEETLTRRSEEGLGLDHPTDAAPKDQAHSNYFDEQYFVNDFIEGTKNINSKETVTRNAEVEKSDMGSNYFGEQYFENQTDKIENHVSSEERERATKSRKHPESSEIKDSDFDHHDRPDEHVGGQTKQQKRQKQILKANVESPQTAYDLAVKLRLEKRGKLQERTEEPSIPSKTKWTGRVDSKGFRILKDQVLDIQNLPQDVVVRILQDSVLFESDDFIAIDKPYGLPSHGGPGVHHSVGKLSQRLAERMETKQLELIHRLDKETTGVMLLAKTNDMAWKLRNMFKERQVIKKYWVITKGVPNPDEGIIDIPMVETEVGDRYRMNLRPYKTEQTALLIKKQQLDIPRKDAVTNFKVLDSNHGAALVECVPESGVKHQIRCHLAFGLNTPILGDHKYSHYSRIAPQKLPSAMLQRLGLRQPLVRYVAMHLHAKALVLPQLHEGRNVFIDCRLPKHFVQNMKWLKLRPPKGV